MNFIFDWQLEEEKQAGLMASLLSHETIHYVYSNIKIINEAMARRLRAICEKNVAVNSSVIE